MQPYHLPYNQQYKTADDAILSLSSEPSG